MSNDELTLASIDPIERHEIILHIIKNTSIKKYEDKLLDFMEQLRKNWLHFERNCDFIVDTQSPAYLFMLRKIENCKNRMKLDDDDDNDVEFVECPVIDLARELQEFQLSEKINELPSTHCPLQFQEIQNSCTDNFNRKTFSWTEFENNFKLLSLDRNDLSPLGKMKYLKTYLVGAATELIQDQGSARDLPKLLEIANQVLQALHDIDSTTHEGLIDHMVVWTEEVKLDYHSVLPLLDCLHTTNPSSKDKIISFLTERIQWLRRNDQSDKNSLMIF